MLWVYRKVSALIRPALIYAETQLPKCLLPSLLGVKIDITLIIKEQKMIQNTLIFMLKTHLVPKIGEVRFKL